MNNTLHIRKARQSDLAHSLFHSPYEDIYKSSCLLDYEVFSLTSSNKQSIYADKSDLR